MVPQHGDPALHARHGRDRGHRLQPLLRHWGLFFAVLIYFADLWPGSAISSATLTTFLFGGGGPAVIAVAMLLVVGLALTLAPVVDVLVERVIFLRSYRVAALVFGACSFGVLSVITIVEQGRQLFE